VAGQSMLIVNELGYEARLEVALETVYGGGGGGQFVTEVELDF